MDPSGEPSSIRCVVSDPVPVHPPDVLRDLSLVRGPNGPRVEGLTADHSLYWSDSAGSGVSPDGVLVPPEGAVGARVLAWTRTNYLTVNPDGVQVRDGNFANPRSVRTGLPPGACVPSLMEMADRALLTWRRPTRRAICDPATGVPWLQVVNATGEPLGSPRALVTTERTPHIGALRARWDYGRVVIEARDLDVGALRYWVLDPWGAELARGTAGHVACPRSGCFRVRAVDDSAGANRDTAVLRLDPLDGSPGFSTTTPAASVSSVVVSGDLVLVLYPAAGEATGCSASVIHAARHAALVTVTDDIACDPARVIPTSSGFELVLEDSGRDTPSLTTRAIACTD